MCGIAGFVGIGTEGDLDEMTRSLAHRGPDGSGSFVDSAHRVFLGHRRLAIIDVSGGLQPMSSSDTGTTIVFNGEIYNHRHLRRELEQLGHQFVTDHSDTEVILRGYDAWGEAVVERLDGMFAFAIYDVKRQRLFLARDRFGEKPLFYHVSHKGIVFASELAALRKHPSVAALQLDERSLQKFFAYSFLPGAATPYRGVQKLLPGSVLTYRLSDGFVQKRQYWRFAIVPDQRPEGNERDWIDQIRSLLMEAVASRLESDVPLGVFLSGGIDSSAIAILANRERSHGELSTFTIGFHEASYDESAYAEQVARFVGSSHHVEFCDVDFMLASASKILETLAEPLGDPSLIPTYLVSAYASRYVKVALSGDGGDELFAGYDPFKALKIADHYQKWVPRPVHAAIRAMAAKLPVSDRNMSFQFKLNRALRGMSQARSVWNPVWLAALEPDDISRVFGTRVAVDELYEDAIELWDGSRADNLVDRTLEFYTNLYLPDDILMKSDRAGMMNSLEIRAPFLHSGLADYVSRLPAHTKFRNGTTKWILKEALKDILPSQILQRPKKGFGIPVAQWLRDMPSPHWRPIEGLNDKIFRQWDLDHRRRSKDHRGGLWCRYALDRTVGVEQPLI
ncbi:asparagine synthase (glutamine-hydrolyzing) [Microvirga puerhi]|uniref:asparagine synthase (glutamine-hydrolyzing) n=1 Tax=Microvirga puerhi TaxID=2876078 RepID=A0ABS7VME6_9HYPH|nr:asparagine synthase (glutamine-hydrolyzing) [Microvirga puerhi]MBZ6076260.1 asparagine synthase (glutamine-hydrolyzing) [Microvirga puerhi]